MKTGQVDNCPYSARAATLDRQLAACAGAAERVDVPDGFGDDCEDWPADAFATAAATAGAGALGFGAEEPSLDPPFDVLCCVSDLWSADRPAVFAPARESVR